MGRHDEAYAEIERARQISPQSAVIATAVANVLFLAGKFDEAVAQCRKSLDLDAGAVAAHTILRWAYELKGMHAEAMAAFEQERSFAGDTPRRTRNAPTYWPRPENAMKQKRSWVRSSRSVIRTG
jgi:tetratricopeptide (TPR) repeat protein